MLEEVTCDTGRVTEFFPYPTLILNDGKWEYRPTGNIEVVMQMIEIDSKENPLTKLEELISEGQEIAGTKDGKLYVRQPFRRWSVSDRDTFFGRYGVVLRCKG